ncbi:MAG TPA: hypothetical protein PKY05_15825 [Fibrobacteria bacterium]|nr:hypothetical protein [Fibrobacteria bacterium]
MSRFCGSCGTPFGLEDKFCSGCGAPAAAASTSAPSRASGASELASGASGEGIEVVVGYRKNPLLWLLVEDLRVSFDGGPEMRIKEGRDISVRLPPGRHRMVAYVPYFMPPKCGYVKKPFDLGSRPLRITFNAPWITFMEGSVKVREM